MQKLKVYENEKKVTKNGLISEATVRCLPATSNYFPTLIRYTAHIYDYMTSV
jgi:hypothetical protein